MSKVKEVKKVEDKPVITAEQYEAHIKQQEQVIQALKDAIVKQAISK